MRSQLLMLATLAVLASTWAAPMPRYLVIPLDNVALAEAVFNPTIRVRRSPQQEQLEEEDLEERLINANRRQGLGRPLGPGPAHEGPVDAPFIKAVKAAGIPNADDSLAAGSNVYGHPPKGNDYVDYGAYTGKNGAFGWYGDYPVALKGHHY